jgi:hypothetical protein
VIPSIPDFKNLPLADEGISQGADYTYTNNWPYDPDAGNHPSTLSSRGDRDGIRAGFQVARSRS